MSARCHTGEQAFPGGSFNQGSNPSRFVQLGVRRWDLANPTKINSDEMLGKMISAVGGMLGAIGSLFQ